MSTVPRRTDKPPKLKSVSKGLSASFRRKRKKKTPLQLCKERIQEKLRQLAIILYGDCEAKEEGHGNCWGPLQADHIETRGSANTYALIANIILLCSRHHLWWKRQFPGLWAILVEKKRGVGTIERLHHMAIHNNRTNLLADWLAAEKILDDQIAAKKEKETLPH